MTITQIIPGVVAVRPRGQRGLQGPPGAPGDQINFTTKLAAAATNIDSAVDFLRVAGYATIGDDGGGSCWRRVVSAPSHLAWFQSADGAYWEYCIEGSINLCHLGGVGDGVTPNDDVFEAAFGLMQESGAGLYSPPGVFVLNAKITYDLPDWLASFCVKTDGGGTSRWHWPNADGGIVINSSTSGGAGFSHNVVDIGALKLTTGQAGGGTALRLNEGGSVNTPGSHLRNLVIQGDDYNQGAGSHYWDVDVHLFAWEAIVFDNVQGNGKWINPLTSALGVGVLIEGDLDNERYTQSIKFQNCNFGYHSTPILLKGWFQGVLISQCNFGGNIGIHCPAEMEGVLTQVNVSNSIFYCATAAIKYETNIIDTQTSFNNVIQTEAGGHGFDFGPSTAPITNGNVIAKLGAASGRAISSNGYGGMLGPDKHSGFEIGVELLPGSSDAIVYRGQYPACTSEIIDIGTGNTLL